MLGAGEHLELVLDAVLFEEPFEFARDVLRHAAIGLGEGVIELALHLPELQMWRVFLVGNDADPVERGGRFDPMREACRGGGDVLAAHAIADTTHRPRFCLVLRVDKAEQARGVVHDLSVCQAVHRRAHALEHLVVAPVDVEAQRAEPVVHVRQHREIALLGDAPRHVAQFFADAGRIHVEDDPGVLARRIRAGHKARHLAVFGRDDDVLFDHGGGLRFRQSAAPSLARLRRPVTRFDPPHRAGR